MRYPKDIIKQKAEDVIKRTGGDVYFKAECPHCGQDCVVEEPNTWYDNLECCKCGKAFPVVLAGFMLHMK